MTKITVFISLVFTVKCLSGEDLEMDMFAAELKNKSNVINGTTGSAAATEVAMEVGGPTNEWEDWVKNCTLTKHVSFCNCSQHISLHPEDYTMINGTAHVSALNRTYHNSFYELRDGYVLVCLPDSESNQSSDSEKDGIVNIILSYITVIGLALSLLGLLIHLIAFVVIPNMKNMPGCCLASLCASMLLGFFSFLVGNAEGISSSRIACVANAAISHFLILSSLLWMNVKAFDIYMVLYHSTTNLRLTSTSFSCKKFCKFCLYGWGVSFLLTTAALICDNVDGVPLAYKPLFAREICWFNQLTATWAFFVGPAFAIIGINFILFCLSVYTVYNARMETDDSQQSQTRSYFATYYKLALIMGVLWLSGIFARITDNIVFWYVFALSNAAQGFFIFLTFTYSELKKYTAEKFKTTRNVTSNVISKTTTATNISLGDHDKSATTKC